MTYPGPLQWKTEKKNIFRVKFLHQAKLEKIEIFLFCFASLTFRLLVLTVSLPIKIKFAITIPQPSSSGCWLNSWV
jgi:hypothetical protein